MPRGMGRIVKTPRCNCDSPNVKVIATRKGKLGKNLGVTFYTYYCFNCKAQWESKKKLGG